MDALWTQGFALLPQLLTATECRDIRALYDDPAQFRSRIDMKCYRFGQGEYQYFAYPLPERIAALRARLYEQLAPLARQWMTALKLPADFPDEHARFIETCHAAGQLQPTPLLLRYRAGDFNCLHQDLSGAIFFPFQVVVCLSAPGDEFTGGELMLVEQLPRAQSVGRVVPLGLGDGAAITTRYRPAQGSRGFYRTNMN